MPSDSTLVSAFAHEFARHRTLTTRAIGPLSDDDFFRRPGEAANSVALVVKHLAGNLTSRWSDFLTTDGEKPWRDRDGEFVIGPPDTRASLLAAWERAWEIVAGTLAGLNDGDLEKQVTIRGEPHSVFQALLRSSDHTAYHAGQIMYLARLFRPDARWQTIAPGQSKQRTKGDYLPPR
jgi:uncharacterized damage-inducible protein DinB